MSAPAIFEHPDHGAIRVEMVDGEPWFVAADICAALEHTNTTVALRMLDSADVRQISRSEALNLGIGGLDPRVQSLNLVSEPGFFDLALRSQAPGAKAFRRWVTHDVLPAIRRTGGYSLTPAVPQTLPEALRLAADLADERDRHAALLEAQAPKVEAYEALMDADGNYSMNAAAKAVGLGRNTMMRRLRELDVLQGNNLPYQRHAHHFEVVLGTYTDRNGQTHPTATTKVRPTGADYIRRRLANVEQAAAIARGGAA